jgi:hypothetical protein
MSDRFWQLRNWLREAQNQLSSQCSCYVMIAQSGHDQDKKRYTNKHEGIWQCGLCLTTEKDDENLPFIRPCKCQSDFEKWPILNASSII